MGKMFKLDPDLEERLSALTEVNGRDTDEQIREAILRGLEDMEDIAAAEATLERIERGEERTFSHEEVVQRLGLEG